MTFALHPRIQQLLAAGAGPAGSPGSADVAAGDTLALRRVLDHGLAQMSGLPAVGEVSAQTHVAETADGHRLMLRWYRLDGSGSGNGTGPAVIYLHGGAMIAGSVDLYDPLVRTYVAWSGVPFLAVDYRLAPEAPAGTASRDAFAALHWLLQHTTELGVDRERIAVMGDSGGGGIAAATAILARDDGVHLAKQILIYPMLDDRTTGPDRQLAALPTVFSHEFNTTAWSAVLGGLGAGPVPATVAPARLTDFAGLAPAYIEVGELDIFRDEDVAYAQRLWAAGISTELHVHPGYPHAFDILLMGDDLGIRHKDEKIRILRGL